MFKGLAKTFFVSLVIVICFAFFFVFSTECLAVVEEDFEDKALDNPIGNIDDAVYGNWAPYPNFEATSTQAIATTSASNIPNICAGYYELALAINVEGNGSFRVLVDNENWTRWIFGLYDTTANLCVSVRGMDLVAGFYDIQQWEGVASTSIYATVNATLWHTVHYQIQSISGQYRIKINNGEWSPYYFFDDVDCNEITHISIYAEGMSTYFDEFENSTDTSEDEDVVILELPDEQLNIYVSSEDYITVPSKYCLVDEDCYVNIYYSYEAIGDEVELYQEIGDSDIFVASTTLEDKFLTKTKIDLNTETSATTTYYCIFSTVQGSYTCGIKVVWVSEEEFAELMDTYNIDSACDDMDQTASTTVMYAIECAFRKFGYWLVTPHARAFVQMTNSMEKFNTNFPMSVYKDVQTMFLVLDEAESEPLEIPIVWYDNTGIEILYAGEVSSTTIAGYLGEENYNRYYGILEIIIYLFGFFWLVTRLVGMSRKTVEVE